MKIVALPALAVPNLHEDDLVKNKTWALISIAGAREKFPPTEALEADPNFKGVLRLRFCDVDSPRAEHEHFLDTHARQILDFVESKYPYLDLLVVHCHAGLCRSPAVGAAVSRIFNGHDGGFFETKYPNMLVYRTILNTHQARKHPEKALFSS